MSDNQPRLIDLFERATAQQVKQPDLVVNLQIVDRMNMRRRQQSLFSCLQGIEYFKQLLKSSDLKTVKLTLTLLETCVKNCHIHFHRYVNNRDLMQSILQLLKRKRKKLNMVEKLAGLYKRQGWREIESRVLAMIQLWADTFMMHQDKYPCFMRAYRELRKEQIKFPPRDPNQRFMINFQGEPSPAFQLADLEQQVKPEFPRNNQMRRSVQEEEEQEPKLLEQDVYKLQMYLPELEELIGSSREVKRLQEPSSKELVKNCRQAQKKLIDVVQYKTIHGASESEIMEMLEMMDYINQKMESFKTATRLINNGASEEEVRNSMKIKTEIKPADNLLDEEFLEIPMESPLKGLKKFMYSEKKFEEEKKEEEEIPQVKQHHKLQEPPDLLFEEEEFVSEQKIQKQDTFDLTSLIFNAPTNQTAENPAYFLQQMPGGPAQYIAQTQFNPQPAQIGVGHSQFPPLAVPNQQVQFVPQNVQYPVQPGQFQAFPNQFQGQPNQFQGQPNQFQGNPVQYQPGQVQTGTMGVNPAAQPVQNQGNPFSQDFNLFQ